MIEEPLSDKIRNVFKAEFKSEPVMVSSPGRINLLGEHTDYNEGFVIPAAINLRTYIALGKRKDNELHFIAVDYNEHYITSLNDLEKSGRLWPDYLIGVLRELKLTEYQPEGLNVVIGSDIPSGAGLSSSAALESAFIFGLNNLFNVGLDRLEMARIGQRAENNFVGVKCGIMDQFASIFGKADMAIRLDCRTLDYEYLPFSDAGISILLLDTGVKHSLASSAYNERRMECQMGVNMIQAELPQVQSLRDVTGDMLLKYVHPFNKLIYNRCLYVVTENERLLHASADLGKGDIGSFGKKMFDTHQGLQYLYEVSCLELDLLVDLVRYDDDVLGARMMGGGFGGCTINLVKEPAVGEIIRRTGEAYLAATGKPLKAYEVRISEGTILSKCKK